MKKIVFSLILGIFWVIPGYLCGMEEQPSKKREREETAEEKGEISCKKAKSEVVLPRIKLRPRLSQKYDKQVRDLRFLAFYAVVENFVEGREEMAASLARLPVDLIGNLSASRLYGDRPFLHFASTPEEVKILYKSCEKPEDGIDEKTLNILDGEKRTLLNSLIVRRKPKAAHTLLKLAGERLNLTIPDCFDNAPLDNAVKQGYFDLVQRIIEILKAQNIQQEKKQYLDEQSKYKGALICYTTLLHIEDNAEHIQELLSAGCDPNAENSEQQTVFNAFIIQRKLDAAYMLLNLVGEKLDVSTPDRYGSTPLLNASKAGYLDLVGHILEQLKIQNKLHTIKNGSKNNQFPFMVVCMHAPEIVRMFINYGADVNYQLKDGRTTLDVVPFGSDAFKAILEAKPTNINLNQENSEDNTLLMKAILEGHIGLLRPLVDAGASINFVATSGWTPLMTAAFLGKNGIEELKELLSLGADNIDFVNENEQSALTKAIDTYVDCDYDFGDFAMIELLINKGATIHEKDLELASENQKLSAYLQEQYQLQQMKLQ